MTAQMISDEDQIAQQGADAEQSALELQAREQARAASADVEAEEAWLAARAQMAEDYQKVQAIPSIERSGPPGWPAEYTEEGIPNPWEKKPTGNPPGPAMTYGFEEASTVPRGWNPGEQETVKGLPAKNQAILQEILAKQKEKGGK